MKLNPFSLAVRDPSSFARMNPANSITPLRVRAFAMRAVASACRRLGQLIAIAEEDADMTEKHLADVVEAESARQVTIRQGPPPRVAELPHPGTVDRGGSSSASCSKCFRVFGTPAQEHDPYCSACDETTTSRLGPSAAGMPAAGDTGARQGPAQA